MPFQHPQPRRLRRSSTRRSCTRQLGFLGHGGERQRHLILPQSDIDADTYANQQTAIDEHNNADAINDSLDAETISNDADEYNLSYNTATDELDYVKGATGIAVSYQSAVAGSQQNLDVGLADNDPNASGTIGHRLSPTRRNITTVIHPP